jgi:hypothetical protein
MTLDIQEDVEGLTLRVIGRSIWRIVFACGVLLFFMFFIFHRGHESGLFSLIVKYFCMAAAAWAVFRELRGTDVTLRVTRFEVVSSGHAPEYHPSSMPRSAVYSLEYFGPIEGGGESQSYPGGLHIDHVGASLDRGTCILPHIDSAQTAEAIAAILRRFPDTGKEGRPVTGFSKSDILTLNLNN